MDVNEALQGDILASPLQQFSPTKDFLGYSPHLYTILQTQLHVLWLGFSWRQGLKALKPFLKERESLDEGFEGRAPMMCQGTD